MTLAKAERVAIFVERLEAAPAAGSTEEALALVHEVLDAVEDEHTDIRFNPAAWASDGRMYGPQEDNARSVPGMPDVTRYRSRNHDTLIGDNGAILIEKVNGPCVLNKPGLDGQRIR